MSPPNLPTGHGDEQQPDASAAQSRRQRHQVHRRRRGGDQGRRRQRLVRAVGARHRPRHSAADQAKLFQEFQQADNPITKKGAPDWGSPYQSESSRCTAGRFGLSSARTRFDLLRHAACAGGGASPGVIKLDFHPMSAIGTKRTSAMFRYRPHLDPEPYHQRKAPPKRGWCGASGAGGLRCLLRTFLKLGAGRSDTKRVTNL